MLLWLIRPLRYAAQLLSPHDSPRQLAMGFALGTIVGLVPKGNLTAAGLTVVLFASRVNLGTGMIAAFCFSWIGTLLDPMTHRVGLAILTYQPLQPLWARLHDLPLVPWTGLNNTVVLGSLLLGTGQCYFSYRLVKPLFTRYQPVVLAQMQKLRKRIAMTDGKGRSMRRAA